MLTHTQALRQGELHQPAITTAPRMRSDRLTILKMRPCTILEGLKEGHTLTAIQG